MFWSLILPAQVTLCLSVLAIATVWWFAPRWHYPALRSVLLTTLLAGILFVPSCIGVKCLIDPFRFGNFEHPDFAAVNDWRVERYLPDAATDITLQKPAHGNGFRAKFHISKQALDGWFDKSWIQGKQYSVSSPEDAQEVVASPRFDELGWTPPADAVRYVGPCESDGGGYIIWFAENDGIAYEDAGYW